ncbi:alpha/beta fold hydrolase [Hymenobacter wooponensis]|uniref:Alpha/beta hydrolase n=1 Tax=Hymenobacter wooponensis TaxID=1525360 RepID=A0A4Z0MSV3_9BACT|nr:alpha/beta hydrolase [Hymenobacter wooponensis]TGD82366.1 alpha/beta hydrolase [Hymenobacter wooponensis]
MLSSSEFVTISLPDQRTLSLRRYGNPKHPAVLFFHGYASSCLGVPDVPAVLSRLGLQVLAPDRPGVGQSTAPEHTTLELVAADAVAALDALDVPIPLAVAAWSGGGPYAMALAALYPQRVASLHLLSTVLPLGDPHAYPRLTLPWKATRFANDYLSALGRVALAAVSRKWEKEPEKTIDEYLMLLGPAERAVRFQHPTREILRDAAVRGFAQNGLGVFLDGQALCRAPTFQLSAIQATTTLWHGSNDGVWAPDNITYLTTHIPQAHLRLIPGESHMLYLNHWEAILNDIRADLPPYV